MAQIILDVRSKEEWDQGHIEGAILIPHTEISAKIEAIVPDKNAKILIHCRSGGRAGVAQGILKDKGYTNTENVGGLEDAKRKLGK